MPLVCGLSKTAGRDVRFGSNPAVRPIANEWLHRVDCGHASAEATIALRADDLVLQRGVVAMVCHHPR
jgi:hypothetical protein